MELSDFPADLTKRGVPPTPEAIAEIMLRTGWHTGGYKKALDPVINALIANTENQGERFCAMAVVFAMLISTMAPNGQALMWDAFSIVGKKLKVGN